MRIFWDFCRRYVQRYFWWYLGGVLCILATQALMILIVDLIKLAVDAYSANDATPSTIFPFALKILLIAPLVVLIRTTSRLLIFTPGRLAEFHIRNQYYSSLLYLQRDFFSKHETGDLVSRCSNDIGFVRGAFGFGFLQVANVSITLVLVIRKMLQLDAATTVTIAIPMIVSFAIIMASIRYMFSFWRTANIQLGALSSLCLASYKGVSAIQNYHAEPCVETRFYEANRAYLDTQRTVTKARTFAMPLVQLVGYFSIFLVMWVVGPKVVDGGMTMGEVVAFNALITMVMPPLLSLGWMLNVFNQAIPAIERLDEILLAEPGVTTPAAVANTTIERPVRLHARGLSFRFPQHKSQDNPFSLDRVDFDLPPGKVLGVVGAIGAGKTALLETIVRLNQLQPGQLFVNDIDAASLGPRDYRNFFSFTAQKAQLFSTTLRKNLMIALPPETEQSEKTEAMLLAALENAGFDLSADVFPKGLETEVGEKGVMLSGGQRQRIALARALLKDADIYILDDVLSAVDHETEKEIIAKMRSFAADKSLIISSHRVSAIQWADEILVMDKGRIIDRGVHEALVGRTGFYQDIFHYQSQHPDEAPEWT